MMDCPWTLLQWMNSLEVYILLNLIILNLILNYRFLKHLLVTIVFTLIYCRSCEKIISIFVYVTIEENHLNRFILS